jgi:4,5-dihydroxyphthalate decarboxylase
MANGGTTLRVALGDYPHTLPLKRGEITSPWLKLEFAEVKPLYQAFKPMVREHAFDASEIALVTYSRRKITTKGSLLPAAMLARFHGTMLFNAEGELRRPIYRASASACVRTVRPRAFGFAASSKTTTALISRACNG